MTTAKILGGVPESVKLPLHIKLGNGFGSTAYGVKDNGFSTLLLLFYSQVLGLEAGLHRVHPDPVLGQIGSGAFGQVQYAGLGHGIGGGRIARADRSDA